MITLMLATTNAGKAAEFRALLSSYFDLSQISLFTPMDWPTSLPSVCETGASFAENALLKARSLAETTGMTTLADDSGLCVDALGGEPGLHSARWAGEMATDEDRVRLLLERIQNIAPEKRTARFVCAIALVSPDGNSAVTESVCEGLVTDKPIGSNGFGYDPIFLLPQYGRTMAELSTAEKNAISHRAAAIQALIPNLGQIFLRLPV